MTLHPEDVRYWFGWFIGGVSSLSAVALILHVVVTRPIVRAIRNQQNGSSHG